MPRLPGYSSTMRLKSSVVRNSVLTRRRGSSSASSARSTGPALFEQVSALPHLTADDPPAILSYGSEFDTEVTNDGIGIHHALFGKMLKEKMDPLGIECEVYPRSRRGQRNQNVRRPDTIGATTP